MITDDNYVLIRGGGLNSSPLLLFNDETLVNAWYIAEAPNFKAIGERPGISDDSSIISFMGDSSDQGVGIFAENGATLFKIAGISGDPYTDPGEYWIDFNNNELKDPGEIVGPFDSVNTKAPFILSRRVAVNRKDVNSNQRYFVVYLANGKTNSENDLGPLGVYISAVDVSNPASPAVGTPYLVVETGQTIGNLSGVISDIQFYDPINNRGQLVFWIRTTTDIQAIISATPACLWPEDDVDSNGNLDNDGDGICDSWETYGIDFNGDGTKLDLPGMGADMNHRDIFVEIDYMVAGDHTHKPWSEAMDLVTTAFLNAPVENPDGTTGIKLHLDYGPNAIMNPISSNPVAGDVWGEKSKSEPLLHITNLGADSNLLRNNFFPIRDNHFLKFNDGKEDSYRSPVFHYFIFAHFIFELKPDNTYPSGTTFGKPGSNSIVALGSYKDGVGSVWNQAGTFMHELGHQLGLDHGGEDSVNYKPNYLSVMNYSFQMNGLPINKDHPDHPGENYAGALDGYFDYSRFNSISVPDLNELHLNEPVGLNSPTLDGFGTQYYCGIGDERERGNLVDFVNLPIDWNCDGFYDLDMAADINKDGSPPAIDRTNILKSYNDWENLVYDGGSIGGWGIAFHPLPEPSDGELTAAENALISVHHGVEVYKPAVLFLAPGAAGLCKFIIKNTGHNPDDYFFSLTSEKGWVNPDSLPASISLGAGEESVIEIAVEVPGDVLLGELDHLVLKANSGENPFLTDLASASVFAIAKEGDTDGDCDVDGVDLAAITLNPNLMDLLSFAANFGTLACP
jgi:hypothetical protein